MAPRPSTALSKRVAECRSAHQIPRNRPAHLPPPRTPATKIRKPVARPLKKKPLPKPELQNLQQPRGENRINGPRPNGAAWSIRRILASRRSPSEHSILEYKVQWDTSWEDASNIKGLAVNEWNEALDDGGTFEFRDRNGDKWTVLKDETGGENDHEDMQWDMWVAIHRNVREEFGKNWLDGVREADFEYGDGEQEKRAVYEAKRHGLREPTSALDTLRTAWKDLGDNPQLRDDEILYAAVHIRYTDRLDSHVDPRKDKSSARPTLPISTIVRTLHSDPFDRFDVKMFTRDHDTCAAFEHYRSVVCDLVHTTPFMFKAGTWMNIFALLLLSGDNMTAELAKVGIMVEDDWAMRMREYDMHMYYEQVVDNRAPHDIQETYLCLREFFRELKPEDEDEGDQDRAAVSMEDSMKDVPSSSVEASQPDDGRSRSLQLQNHLFLAQNLRARHSRPAAPSLSTPAASSDLSTTPILSADSSSLSARDKDSPTPSSSASSPSQIPAIMLPRAPRPSISQPHTFSAPGFGFDLGNQEEAIRKEKNELLERLAQLAQQEAVRGYSEDVERGRSRKRSFA
ncbi:hypothetical protein CC80DRAFT_544226 [Byssothecium circinans]|uniref:Uncharacterized protein n=1 Tax=Byssothecium circinans TaxID=147558 RepID=A0A6A5U921_9PLEO|nr:hypothetical protein CC80DRAFT_544226 [Byssothecium circinans]